MASLSKDGNGRRRLQFADPDGRRRTIRLGKLPQREAEAIKTRVEHLIASKLSGCGWDGPTAQWVAGLPDALADKLAAAGLIPKRRTATLDSFIGDYIESRTDLKLRTIMKLRTARRVMVEYFGAERPLREITPGDADGWRLDMLARGLSENTARKYAANAKQFFTAAVRKRLIPASPFVDLKSTVQPNPSRYYYVTRLEAQQVIDACPDAQWRLIFTLARYGGLRCPSEVLALRLGRY